MKAKQTAIQLLLMLISSVPVSASAATDHVSICSEVITLTSPNTLRATIANKGCKSIRSLTLRGTVGSDDLNVIFEDSTLTSVQTIDISDITLVPDEGQYAKASESSDMTFNTYYYFLSSQEKADTTSTTNALGWSYTTYKTYTTDLSCLFLGKEKLKTISMPQSIKTIGEKLCRGCTALRNISVASDVKEIKYEAFYGCTGLKSVNISKPTKIGVVAFYDVPISTLDLSECTELGESAFAGSGLKEANLTQFTTIPGGVFSGCKSLTTVTTSANLSTVENSAFYGCEALKTIKFTDRLESLGEGAFKNSGLTTVEGMPEAFENFYGSTFEGTPYLKNLSAVNGVRYIGSVAVSAAAGITKLSFKEGMTKIIDNFNFEGSNYYNDIKSVTFPQSLRYIGTGLGGISIQSLTIPENVEYIAGGGLPEATTLYYNAIHASGEVRSGNNKIVVGRKVRYLPRVYSGVEVVNFVKRSEADGLCTIEGFNNCRSLSEFNGFQYVDSIKGSDAEGSAFYLCHLKSVTLPSNIKYIGNNAFRSCKYLTKVYYDVPDAQGYQLFRDVVTDLTIGPNVRAIPECAFMGNKNLTEIKLVPRTSENVLIKIGEEAFARCTALKNLDILQYVDTIDDKAFQYCTFDTIYLNSNIVSLGASSFKYCDSLKYVYYDVSGDGRYGDFAFYKCKKLNKVTFGTNVRKIPPSLFNGVKSLKIIEFEGRNDARGEKYKTPRKVSTDPEFTIGDYAFYGCTGLNGTDFSVPAGTTEIGESAFENVHFCNFSVPTSLTKIIDYYTAYPTIDTLYIYAPAPPQSWRLYATVIYVLPQSLDSYKNDYWWGKYNILPMDEAHLPTGVKSIVKDTANRPGVYYDLGGRRIKNPQPGTIIIHNGKKETVKQE